MARPGNPAAPEPVRWAGSSGGKGPGGAGWKIHATVATYGGETQRLRKMPQNWKEI